jgi:NADPH-dependent 2,4-dienoyl-CoA reductase/sulfur reductase-like enzyme
MSGVRKATGIWRDRPKWCARHFLLPEAEQVPDRQAQGARTEVTKAALEKTEYDVIVAGSGAGGMSAAVTAAKLGLDVIVIEKEPLFGGTDGAVRRCAVAARKSGLHGHGLFRQY